MIFYAHSERCGKTSITLIKLAEYITQIPILFDIFDMFLRMHRDTSNLNNKGTNF